MKSDQLNAHAIRVYVSRIIALRMSLFLLYVILQFVTGIDTITPCTRCVRRPVALVL